MRYAQFKVPAAKGDKDDGELVIFKGLGGSADANIKRWKDMFVPPEGKSIDDVAKVTDMKVSGANVTYLDVHGTYLFKPPFDPNAKAKPMPDYRRFGVIFASENGPYFITVTGPARTMAQHKKDFDNWLKAFK